MKIAWFTPFGHKSAIGKYSAIIVSQLAQFHEVTVFADGVTKRDDRWSTNVPVLLLEEISQVDLFHHINSYDITIYNLGDHLRFHRKIFEIAQRYPGIVILHDLVMHHFFYSYFVEHLDDPEAYLRELQFAHGNAGYDLGKHLLTLTEGDVWSSSTMLDFNMAKSAVRGAYGVIMHSQTSAEMVASFASAPVKHIFFPTPEFTAPSIQLTSTKVSILTFGMLNTNKQIHTVIEAIGKSKLLRDKVTYEVIGSGTAEYIERLESLINHYQLHDQVKLLGYQPDEVLHSAIANTDIVMNLRNPHFGESSISLIEALAAGKPTVVWNHGYYSEFPDSTVIKVNSEDSVQVALERLATDEMLRKTIGNAAAQYIKENFVTEHTVQHIIEFIETTRYNAPVFRILDDFINEMQIMGVDEAYPSLPELVTNTLNDIVT